MDNLSLVSIHLEIEADSLVLPYIYSRDSESIREICIIYAYLLYRYLGHTSINKSGVLFLVYSTKNNKIGRSVHSLCFPGF
jgi:hypothetical protein